MHKALAGVNWSLLFAQLLAISLPFFRELTPPLIAALVISLMLENGIKDYLEGFKKRKWIIILSVIYFAAHLIGCLNTSNMAEARLDIEIKLSFLVFPLFVLPVVQMTQEKLQQIFQLFLFATATALFSCFGLAAYHYFETGDSSHFFYHQLSYFRHPGYFALFLNVSLVVATTFIFYLRNRINFWYFFFVFISIIGIYQLASRNGILSMTMILIFNFLYFVIPRLEFKRSFLIFLVVSALGILLANNTDFVNKRFTAVSNEIGTEIKSPDPQDERSSAVRLLIWKEAARLFYHNPMLGVGTGDIKDELLNRYAEEGITKASIKKYNAHNQYLQSAAANGILGLLGLIIMVFTHFYLGVKHRLYINAAFAFCIAFAMITESIFERQDGIVLFSFFNVLLWLNFEHATEGDGKKSKLQ